MRTDPLLSILMVAYDSGKYLEGCLTSIDQNVSCPFEVILVDNGPSKAVPDEVTSRYPWLRVIRSEKNLGFNAGNNLAAKSASGKYILLLNIDTILLTDISQALRLLGSDLRIGVVGAQAYDAFGELRPSAGYFPKPWRLWLFRSLWSRPKVPHGPADLHAFKVDWIEGSFLMTTFENWLEVGGFDEKNFLYGNDVDLCRTTKERGLAVVHCTDVKYVHFCGYEVKRMGNLYAGFREYHRKFSTPFERRMADFVLRTGLLLRILAYGMWYGLTKDAGIGDKLRSFAEVRRNWVQLAP
jgi:N-acetylglucosaminyl-diphospho-decaprenol L-rhamnosyltransferase